MVKKNQKKPPNTITQFYISIQGQENIPSFQVSVDDLALMKVSQGLQSLLTHHTNLGLSQGSLQL